MRSPGPDQLNQAFLYSIPRRVGKMGEYSTKCSDKISGHNYLVPGKNYFKREAPAVILPDNFFEIDKNRLIRIFIP